MVKGQGSNSCVSKTHRFSCVKIVKGVGIYDDISVHLSIFLLTRCIVGWATLDKRTLHS